MVVTDEELKAYEPTGRSTGLKPQPGKVQTWRKKAQGPAPSSSGTQPAVKSEPKSVTIAEPRSMYVHVKDPDDQATLTALKQACALYPGPDKIVLVLGADKKSAIKLPFSVDSTDMLIGELVKILGEDAVFVK